MFANLAHGTVVSSILYKKERNESCLDRLPLMTFVIPIADSCTNSMKYITDFSLNTNIMMFYPL